MKLFFRISILVLILVLIVGVTLMRREDGASAGSNRGSIQYYYCPMHRDYRTDKPGIAPCCGMQVEPFYAEADTNGSARDPIDIVPGRVRISSERQQVIGMKISDVARISGAFSFRAFGRVVADETRERRIIPPIDGLIRKVSPYVTGDFVKKDALLATFLNREILRPQQAYIQALNAAENYKLQPAENSPDSAQSLIQAGVDNLEYLGICKSQIRNIALTRKATPEAEIRAPASGILVLRNAFPGTRFERGTELFRIVDVTTTWVLADLFENEARLVRAVTGASVNYQDRNYAARICRTPPQFDPASRALKVRLELDNPDMVLRPGMFVDIEFKLSLPPILAVPVDAIIDSGRETVVYVDKGNGYFDRRQVNTGWRLDGHTQIIRGLNEGERIVTSGSFLVDSESRIARSVENPAGGLNAIR